MVSRKQLRIVLNRFWNQARSADSSRIALLRDYAEIEIPRERFYRDLRRGSYRLPPAEGQCWSCRNRPATQRHHIVLLSKGGRNVAENIVHLCGECHRRIHDWMKPKPVAAPVPFDATPRIRRPE